MPRRRYGGRRRVDALTHEQMMELWLGPRDRKGLRHFEDDGAAEDAWRAHRDGLMREYGEQTLGWWAARRYDLHEPVLPTTAALTIGHVRAG